MHRQSVVWLSNWVAQAVGEVFCKNEKEICERSLHPHCWRRSAWGPWQQSPAAAVRSRSAQTRTSKRGSQPMAHFGMGYTSASWPPGKATPCISLSGAGPRIGTALVSPRAIARGTATVFIKSRATDHQCTRHALLHPRSRSLHAQIDQIADQFTNSSIEV